MGTNYYALDPLQCSHPCEHCQQQTEWHIGKSLVMFQAHRDSPWGPIRSWQDWKRVITEHHLEVIDEYGDRHLADDFIRDVEATDPERRGRQYRWMVDHGHAVPGEDDPRDWLDADGFSMTLTDFT